MAEHGHAEQEGEKRFSPEALRSAGKLFTQPDCGGTGRYQKDKGKAGGQEGIEAPVSQKVFSEDKPLASDGEPALVHALRPGNNAFRVDAGEGAVKCRQVQKQSACEKQDQGVPAAFQAGGKAQEGRFYHICKGFPHETDSFSISIFHTSIL